MLTVTDGNVNVGVAVTVGDNSIVGVAVTVGTGVSVGVEVGLGVCVGSCVAVTVGAAGVNGCSVAGAQADTNRKIMRMILYRFIPLS